jgi:uncharacterized glyoxalase superfamily protein PhnB
MRNDITAQEILAQLGLTQQITEDNYTEIEVDNNLAEIYSYSKQKENRNKKKNTFQQSSVNVRGQAPSFPATPAQAPLVKEDQEIPGDTERPISEPKYGRRINWQNDKIIEIRLQIGNVKIGSRYKRATAYMSIKTETDKRYMIFMKSSMTTACDETFRSIKKDGDKVTQSVAEEFYSDHYNQNLFMGRVKYKVTKGQKIQKHHRTNLPLALIAMWIEDDTYHARFHLLGDDYDFILSDDLSSGQKQYYELEGLWQLYEDPMTMEEAFGG